ncbi:AbrB/MazE/SpoVT family DNA-binding domain-containing protein [Roseateles sp. DB2]|uniref:AbrB/MazE/SpoVT family DNA-binding domain-containing protein n=1 Tax=Roseateles sp. DB2 TaxID=3453717 RepID=UPI003EEB1C8C
MFIDDSVDRGVFVSWVDHRMRQGKVRVPYFQNFQKVLAKITAKNQLTLPKSVTEPLGPVQYFDVQTRGGQIVLTPVRIQRGDALRAKLAELALSQKTLEAALHWAETQMGAVKTIETPKKAGAAKPAKPSSTLGPKKSTARKVGAKNMQSRAAVKATETPKKSASGLRAKPSSARSAGGAAATPARKTAAKPLSAVAKRSKAATPATARSRVAPGSAGTRRAA